MSEITIRCPHTLGLERARRIENAWVKNVTKKLEMTCSTEVGQDKDVVTFQRAGANGVMEVTADCIEVRLSLGLLLSPFKGQIESAVRQQLETSINKEANRVDA